MKNKISFIYKIAESGTNKTNSTLTNKFIILCNWLSLLCIVLTIFFACYYFSLNQFKMVLIEAGFTLLYILVVLINYLDFIRASRIIFNIIILTQLFILSVMLGPTSNLYVFFIPTIMIPFVLFEFSERKIIVFLCLLNVALVTFLYTYIFSNFHSPVSLLPTDMQVLNKLIFYVAICCCIVIIYSLLYINEKTTLQLDIEKETLGLQLEAIFSNSNDGIFLVSGEEGKIIKVNKRALELFETESEKSFFDTNSYNLRKNYPTAEEIEKIKGHFIEQGFYKDIILYKTFRGNYFWGSVFVKPIIIKNQRYHSIRLTDISEQIKSREQIELALKEKELLLSEIHHRVKNNLAIISALINLQIDNLKDNESKIIFEETKDRIYSMALIHNQLYQNKSFAQIEFAQYITNFCSYLIKSYQTNPTIEIIEKTEKTLLDIKTAIPCALILNELITNSFKHAFTNQVKGQIEVGLKKENNTVLFWVSDTGAGMEPKKLQSTSMGMSLITSLVEQIEGKLEYTGTNGSKFLIKFTISA